MKCKNYIFTLLVAFATLLSWWVVPSLVKKATDDSHSYPLNQKLIDITVAKGFNNVIDAFHVVNCGNIPVEFYKKDYANGKKRIILTDEIYKLRETPFADNFAVEAESRWNLVETAW